MIRIFTVFLLLLCIVSAGCTSTAKPSANITPGPGNGPLYGNGTYLVNGTLQQVNGTLHIASFPTGADVYIDDKYWCPTNCALPYVIPPGHHTVEFRLSGYDTVAYPVIVEKGGMEGINITLMKTQDNLTGTPAPTTASPS
jgi:hypothetical protein